jgi:hypothetical protein
MLNEIEFAMLKARGYTEPVIKRISERDAVAVAFKGDLKAAALGRTPDDAARKLVAVVTRP